MERIVVKVARRQTADFIVEADTFADAIEKVNTFGVDAHIGGREEAEELLESVPGSLRGEEAFLEKDS
ncbi:MAG: hypothetical protein ACOCQR_03645 [bacterium]